MAAVVAVAGTLKRVHLDSRCWGKRQGHTHRGLPNDLTHRCWESARHALRYRDPHTRMDMAVHNKLCLAKLCSRNSKRTG